MPDQFPLNAFSGKWEVRSKAEPSTTCTTPLPTIGNTYGPATNVSQRGVSPSPIQQTSRCTPLGMSCCVIEHQTNLSDTNAEPSFERRIPHHRKKRRSSPSQICSTV